MSSRQMAFARNIEVLLVLYLFAIIKYFSRLLISAIYMGERVSRDLN